MSVCSGLDQIEDFLLSSTVPISTGIGLGLGTSSNNTNRTFMGPPISSGNLNGLNLSLNHGLDLTCPTVWDLTQTASQQQSHNSRNDQILNLTQQPLPLQSNHNSFNNRNSRKESSEVGLNLSLQNGMNLTRQAYYYNEGDFDYSNQQQNTVSFESSTPISSHRSNDPPTASANLIMPPHEAHRYSPLNLEHRSSPLNLTHARCSNSKYPEQNQYFNFSHQENYSNYNSSEMMPYSNEPTRVTDPLSSSATSHTSAQNTNGYYYDQISTDFGTTSNNYITSQLQNAKIRLFCSTCSQEFATSNELNKHMEKHNSQLENNVGISINSAASVSISYTNNTSVSSGTTSLIKQASTTSTSNTPTAAGSYTNVKSYSNEFQLQDHSNSNNTFDNVMNFSCDINKTPASSSQPESMTLKVPPVSEKIKAELPAIVAPNNSTKKKSGDETKSLCSECSLAFPTGQDMKKHLDLAHRGRQGGKKYQCIQCAEEFSSVSSHKQHMELHIQEKPFRCHLCGLHLTKASGLKR